jgi:hypothetical protein
MRPISRLDPPPSLPKGWLYPAELAGADSGFMWIGLGALRKIPDDVGKNSAAIFCAFVSTRPVLKASYTVSGSLVNERLIGAAARDSIRQAL